MFKIIEIYAKVIYPLFIKRASLNKKWIDYLSINPILMVLMYFLTSLIVWEMVMLSFCRFVSCACLLFSWISLFFKCTVCLLTVRTYIRYCTNWAPTPIYDHYLNGKSFWPIDVSHPSSSIESSRNWYIKGKNNPRSHFLEKI